LITLKIFFRRGSKGDEGEEVAMENGFTTEARGRQGTATRTVGASGEKGAKADMVSPEFQAKAGK